MKVVLSTVGVRATRMVVALVVTALLVLGSATAAGAAPAGARSSGANFCAVSKGVAQYLVNLESQLRSASSPTRTKAVWSAIMSAEPSIKSSAPGSLKGDVNRVYVAATAINADLKKANWNVASLLVRIVAERPDDQSETVPEQARQLLARHLQVQVLTHT